MSLDETYIFLVYFIYERVQIFVFRLSYVSFRFDPLFWEEDSDFGPWLVWNGVGGYTSLLDTVSKRCTKFCSEFMWQELLLMISFLSRHSHFIFLENYGNKTFKLSPLYHLFLFYYFRMKIIVVLRHRFIIDLFTYTCIPPPRSEFLSIRV